MKKTFRTVAVLTLAGFVVSSCASLNKMKKMEKNIALSGEIHSHLKGRYF